LLRSTPDPDLLPCSLPARKNHDKLCNNFGLQLLSLCKENNPCIVNGRLENGQFTYHSVHGNKHVASTVDYVICNTDNYESVENLCVCDISEFSDNCCIVFSLNVNNSCLSSNDRFVQDTIIWDNLHHKDVFQENLCSKADEFNFLNDKLLSGNININECMDGLSSLMHDISFETFAKTVSNKPDKSKRLNPSWFNNECKLAKNVFYNAKRLFNRVSTNENKLLFLNARNHFCYVKRRAKRLFFSKKKILD